MARNFEKPEDFAQIPLRKGEDGYVVRLGDVAKVELASAERRSYFRSNGEQNVGLGIVKTSTANSLDVARAARAEAERIQPTLPEGTKIFVAFDTTTFIDSAVERVYHTLAEAIVLVLIVIWLFLGSARAALIPAVTVPVCLIAAFIPLYAFGYSINLLTLLALVLCIGLVVDDAIVVLENIQRRADLGEPQAGRRAARHQAGRLRGDRDHRRAGGGVPADRLHAGQHRPPVPRTVGGVGRGGGDLRLRRADADADDVVQAGAAASRGESPTR